MEKDHDSLSVGEACGALVTQAARLTRYLSRAQSCQKTRTRGPEAQLGYQDMHARHSSGHGGGVADLLLPALVFMQVAFGICFVAWWAARLLLGVAGRAPEPARPRAPEPARPPAAAAAGPRRDPGALKPRRRPDRRADDSSRLMPPSSLGQERGARSQQSSVTPTASPRAAVSQTPAKIPARDAGPPRPAMTGTPTRRNRDDSRHRANAARAASRPAASVASPQPAVTFMQAASQARRADEKDSVDNSSEDAIIIKTNMMHFRAREMEGWIQDPGGPVVKPTPSVLRQQRADARLSVRRMTE